MSFRISPFQNLGSQQDVFFNENSSDLSKPASSHSRETHHLRTSAKNLASKVLEQLRFERNTEWPALDAFFYKFVEYHGITSEEVEGLIRNSIMEKGAWLTLCEELKSSSRLMTGVGRFFKHPPAGTSAFLALIAYTLFHPLKRRNDSDLTTRLTQLFDEFEDALDLISFDHRFFLFTLTDSYFRSFGLSCWDSMDQFEGMIRFFDILDPEMPNINSLELNFYESKAQRVVDLLPRKNPMYFLKSLQKDPLFYQQIKQKMTALFTKTKYAESVIKDIFAVVDQVETPQERQKLLLWLLDITGVYPFPMWSDDFEVSPQVEPLFRVLESLKETLPTFCPESLKTTIETYGQFLFSFDPVPKQKVDIPDHYKKLTSFFVQFCRMRQTFGDSEDEKQIDRVLGSLISRFYEDQAQKTAIYHLFDSFFEDLFTYCDSSRVRELTSLTLKLGHVLVDGVDEYNIAKELLNCLYPFFKRESNQILEIDLVEEAFYQEIDRLGKFFPNYKTDLFKARCFILAIVVQLPSNHLKRNLELISLFATLFKEKPCENFCSFVKEIRKIKPGIGLKVLHTIKERITKENFEPKTSLANLISAYSTNLEKMTKLFPMSIAKPELSTLQVFLDLFQDNNSSVTFMGFFDLLYKKAESERMEFLYRFVEFLRPFKINLPPNSRLFLFHAISAIKGDPEAILSELQVQLLKAEEEGFTSQVTLFFENIPLMPLKEWLDFFKTVRSVQKFSVKTVNNHAKKTPLFGAMLFEHLSSVCQEPHIRLALTATHLALELANDFDLPNNHPLRVAVKRSQYTLSVPRNSPKNPYHIYSELLINRLNPVARFPNVPSYVIGKKDPLELTWDQGTLQEKGLARKWTARSLPKGLSEGRFSELFEKIGLRIDSLEPKEKEVAKAHITILSNHSSLKVMEEYFLGSTLFKKCIGLYEELIVGPSDAEVPENLLQFALIAEKIFSSSSEISQTDLLSEQEQILIKFAALLVSCPTGQADALSRVFNILFQGENKVQGLYQDSHAEFSQLVDESVQTALEELFESSSFIFDLANSKKVGELSHQTLYLKAKWARVVGLRYGDLFFDQHSEVLHDNIFRLSADKFQKSFFKFFTPKLVIEKLQKASAFQENMVLYNKFIELLENEGVLPPEWEGVARESMLQKCIIFDLDEPEMPAGLTDYGAVKALEALKYLNVKELPSKRPLFNPDISEAPAAKRFRGEKEEIDEDLF
ncbi:MAG: hypothetical protein Q8L98_08615 [Chlamydiales bacterium]|nr:hypothetical protein [Chlamydiales bacterium]